MTERILSVEVAGTIPSEVAVLSAQGIPDGTPLTDTTKRLVREAVGRYRGLAAPRGKWREIGVEEFGRVYEGEGDNDEETPLGDIYQRATEVALFAVTVGEAVSEETSRLFDNNDLAEAAMLDAAASEAAELAVAFARKNFQEYLIEDGRWLQSHGAMEFSPGYCGWNLTGQRRLFEVLAPQDIDIDLTSDCLMKPLKSVSGVLLVGRIDMFGFDDSYPVCAECRTHSCRDRLAELNQGQTQ